MFCRYQDMVAAAEKEFKPYAKAMRHAYDTQETKVKARLQVLYV